MRGACQGTASGTLGSTALEAFQLQRSPLSWWPAVFNHHKRSNPPPGGFREILASLDNDFVSRRAPLPPAPPVLPFSVPGQFEQGLCILFVSYLDVGRLPQLPSTEGRQLQLPGSMGGEPCQTVEQNHLLRKIMCNACW